MSAITIIDVQPMSRLEAQACLLAIRGNLEDAKQKALDFDKRLGWQALGYPTLAACFEAELGYSFQYGYRLLAAAEVESNVRQLSPTGENTILKERWVRESGIAKLPPAQQVEAVKLANQIAQAETAKQLTATHFKQAVQQIVAKQTVFQTTYFPVSQLFATGKLSLDGARALVAALDHELPRKRGYILQLVAKFGLMNAELVAPIASMFDRPPGQESLVLPEILGGFLGGVGLAKATVSDLKRANYEASKEHAATNTEDKNQAQGIVEKVVTIAIGDWERTKKRLMDELGAEGYSWLRERILTDQIS